MSKFDSLQGRALQFAGQIGDGLRNVPDHAQKWFKAGVAVGAARAGGNALARSTRRHPVLTATAAATALAAVAGLLVYAHRRRRAAEADGAVIQGQSRRVEAQRSAAAQASPRTTSPRGGRGQSPDPAADA